MVTSQDSLSSNASERPNNALNIFDNSVTFYRGAFDDEETAAHVYDLAALKYWGPKTILNFPANMYLKEYHEMQSISKEEYIAFLRHHGNEFAKDTSEYHGVEQHYKSVGWEARIGGISNNKYNYLEIYANEEEATRAYDFAAIEHSGSDVTTNFPISHYLQQAPQILEVQQFSQLEVSQEVNSMPHFLSSIEPQPEGHLQVSFEDPTNLFPPLPFGDPMVEPEATTMAAVLCGASDSPQSFTGRIFEPYMVDNNTADLFDDSYLNGPFEENFENLFMELEHIEGNLGGEGDPNGGSKHNVDGNMERSNEAAKDQGGGGTY
ncbi:AP2-like ethylene-responsive transcription factor At1g16060 [Phoenix dactylifera]|uniref:AP2-like ethylene-responsive transcription factor At1g16060 n=1 Tax=Phoenix dactylifera TaxID=42345 RepID=A0A8B8ZNU4_PHODC|nr:AP2-like ethylene-responsive transcription factor At1g16060 [Phoenix dactylifera]